MWKRPPQRRAHLVEWPRIGPTTLKHLVHDALGLVAGLAVGVRGDGEDRAAADARLVLLRKVPVPPGKLAVELAVAAQVLGADLRVTHAAKTALAFR